MNLIKNKKEKLIKSVMRNGIGLSIAKSQIEIIRDDIVKTISDNFNFTVKSEYNRIKVTDNRDSLSILELVVDSRGIYFENTTNESSILVKPIVKTLVNSTFN
jgi:hypothetical protein